MDNIFPCIADRFASCSDNSAEGALLITAGLDFDEGFGHALKISHRDSPEYPPFMDIGHDDLGGRTFSPGLAGI